MDNSAERYRLIENKEAARRADTFSELLEKAKERPVEAIVVLSGNIKKIITRTGEKVQVIAGQDITGEDIEDPSVRLSSTAYGDPKSGVGKAKELAAAEMSQELPQVQGETPITIVTNSTSPNNKTGISDAIISEEALRKRGVENEIILQERSINTFSELLETIRLATEKGWKHIAITVIETQSRRARALTDTILHMDNPQEAKKAEESLADDAKRFDKEKLPERAEDHARFKESYEYLKTHKPQVEVSIVAAEDVLAHRHPELYGALLKKLKDDPVYAQKLRQDENDVERWVSGAYSGRGAPFVEQWKKGELP